MIPEIRCRCSCGRFVRHVREDDPWCGPYCPHGVDQELVICDECHKSLSDNNDWNLHY